ncbi:hypothetical protein OKA04_12745 [Luteolibacter flavescens]|uniref:DUF1351 domain-containing protein n=1 Tax=Luteolibacter flavescens TaxID=1859460 RepID=A0ABT3FQL1_9BACT|nr:hypothetical protein [Luteolibacter flavescens]MCW1885599.1 hypothetical protein [Luteolibacter flavescens]
MNHTFELIPLSIETRGEVIASNVDEFRELVRGALSNINRDLKTDEEFGQAELDVKALKGAEDGVRSAKEKAIADAEQLNALFVALDETAEEIRAPRLELEKLIARRKDEVKNELITAAIARLDCAPRLRAGTFGKGLTECIKGKRTLETMRKALDVAVTTHNGMIGQCRVAIDTFMWDHGKELVPDAEDLEVRGLEYVQGELRRRLDMRRAEAEKKRLAAEAEKAKAEVAEMKRSVAESGKAPLPPIGSVPRSMPRASTMAPTELEVSAEWEAFRAKVLAAFKPVKDAREALRCPGNVTRAAGFAEAVGKAWKEVA